MAKYTKLGIYQICWRLKNTSNFVLSERVEDQLHNYYLDLDFRKQMNVLEDEKDQFVLETLKDYFDNRENKIAN